ncbi:protein phosphatase 2C domain-containing protein [Streptomyces chrestomyceticus]|uniref:protein phosphatase 2C domain-containing protein n=1 Tax=Streptomyces chrestomyceticus TaxID=68185 RepID=UPI0027DE8837|nr:protein phosphatase 2C domain-containing protein [Streptomyces chrestomyceticus]
MPPSSSVPPSPPSVSPPAAVPPPVGAPVPAPSYGGSYGGPTPSYGTEARHDSGPAYASGATHANGSAQAPHVPHVPHTPHAPVPPPVSPGYGQGGQQAHAPAGVGVQVHAQGDAQSRMPHAEASVPPSAGSPYGGHAHRAADSHGGAPDPRIAGYDLAAEAADRSADANGSGPGTGPAGPTGPTDPAGPPHPQAPGGPAEPPAQPPATPISPATPTPSSPEHQTPAQGTGLCALCHAGTVTGDGYCENCGHAQPRERDHMERELPGVAAVTDRGHRHHRNEDFFAVAEGALPDGSPAVLAIVCDGVSSASRPDDASAAASGVATRSLLAALPGGTHPQRAMHDAILAAAKSVNALAAAPNQAQQHDPYRQQNAPACTFVGAVVGGGLLVIGWVGDSRAYWVPDDRSAPAVRLTEDDSWAAQMVANNLMSEAEAYADDRAHAITGWLGADAYELEPHTASFKPDGPGVVVVCTDGLWNYAEAAEQLAAVLPGDAHDRPLHSARTLVAHALAGGGHDNVTVAVVPFPAPSGRAGSA